MSKSKWMQHRIGFCAIQYNVSPYYTANMWMKHWRAKRGRPYVMARHSLKIIKLWERVRSNVVLRSFLNAMSTINTVLDRLSIVDHLSWIISVTWRQSNIIPGKVRTIELVSLSIVQLSTEVMQEPPQCCCISWRLFLGIRRAPSDQVMTLSRMPHTLSAIRLNHSYRFAYLWNSKWWY